MFALIAQMGLESAVETANDKHLAPWLELLKQYSIEHTPLSPFIHIELLRQNHLSIGVLLSRALSFIFFHNFAFTSAMDVALRWHCDRENWLPLLTSRGMYAALSTSVDC